MSGFSEEVHLRNKVSRAFGSARNASPEKRREVSGELLKCLQSNYQSVRTAASRQLALLFKHMGEMQEQAIDTILDLCEDPETSVRMIGYKLLMDTARREPAWAPRNTDVLVQLLQNEDPLELQTIQNSLFEIIKDLPAKSLPILVEYLVGDGAEHTTELRDHVITFLTGRSSHEIIPILLQDGAGAQLIEGLVKVLSGASATNAQLIVDKLLHPFFRERPHPKLAHNAVRSILHNVESPRRNSDGEVQQLDGDQLVMLYELAGLLACQCESITPAVEIIVSADPVFPRLPKLQPDVQITFIMVMLNLFKSRLSSPDGANLSEALAARTVMTNWLSDISKTLIQASGRDPEAPRHLSYYLKDVVKPQLDRDARLRERKQSVIKEVRLALERLDEQSFASLIAELKKVEIAPVKINRTPPVGPAKRGNAPAEATPSQPTPPIGPFNKRKADSLVSTPAASPAPSLISRLNINEPAVSDGESPEVSRETKRPRTDSLLSRLGDKLTPSPKPTPTIPVNSSHPLPPRPSPSVLAKSKTTEIQMHNNGTAAVFHPEGLRMRGAASTTSQSQSAPAFPDTPASTAVAPSLSFLGAAKKLQAAGIEKPPPAMLTRLQQSSQSTAKKAGNAAQGKLTPPSLLTRTQTAPASASVVSLMARLQSQEVHKSLADRISPLRPNGAGVGSAEAGNRE